jgi:hypothetical protein
LTTETALATEEASPPLEALTEPSAAELALLDKRAEAIARRSAEAPPSPHSAVGHFLTLPQAARYAGCAKPNGQPRDSFYTAIRVELGQRKRVRREEIDDLITSGRL